MRALGTFFLTALRGQLASWRTWCLLLLLPLIVFGAARLSPAEEVSAPVQVGVVLPEEGGERFWSLLEERSGTVVTFRQTDGETARRQVATGAWDCAFLLPDDFEERLSRAELYELVTLLTGPGSTVYPVVRETAAAALAQCVSPTVAERYLLRSGIADQDTIGAMRPRLQEVLEERVLIAMETADGRPLDPIALADSGRDQLLAGLTAILLLIWALLIAMDLGRWLGSPFARRLAPLEEAPEAAAPDPDPAARLDLCDAVERLDPRDQAIIRLRFFEDRTLEEIARITSTNLNTVKSRLYKSLRRLRELTGEEC